MKLSSSYVIFDFGHDDDSVWQVQHFGCLGLIFCGRRSASLTSTKSGRDLGEPLFCVFFTFSMIFRDARDVL